MNTPHDTIEHLVQAINRGDANAAATLYEKEAVMVAQPGALAAGASALRQALAGFIALKPTLTMEAREVVQTGDLALYLSRWNLRGTGPDGKEVRMNGSSTDVLRRQSDGRWLIVIDNPWGIALLAK